MKKVNFLNLGMLAIMLALSLVFISCDNGSTKGSGGTFTVTDIPAEYNGKYGGMEAWGSSKTHIWGNDKGGTYSKISNGKVTLNVYNEFGEGYNGNETYTTDLTSPPTNCFVFRIFDSSSDFSTVITGMNFTSVKFSNGSASVSYNDKMIW